MFKAVLEDCQTYYQRCEGYEICTYVSNLMLSPSNHEHFYGSFNSVLTKQSIPQCTCPTCPERGIGKPVCGSDNKTYRSECHLRLTACHKHLTNLKIKFYGACGKL